MASASPSDEVVIKSPAIAPFEFMTASRVVFGCGTSKKVPSLVKDLVTLEGCADKPALIVTGKSDRFSAPLVESLKAEGIDAVVYHCPGGEPTTATAEAAIALASSNNCGSVIAIGGGTPVDTGKCVAAVLTNGGPSPDLYDFLEVVGRAQPLTTRCAPFVAVPTTAGPGAEVTKNSVLEAGDRKVSMRHQFMLPDVVVVDPELTRTRASTPSRSASSPTSATPLTRSPTPSRSRVSRPDHGPSAPRAITPRISTRGKTCACVRTTAA
jgi:alcohol dehydrogenase class IV